LYDAALSFWKKLLSDSRANGLGKQFAWNRSTVKNLKTMIVYISISHNNTEKVAKVLADTLSADLKRADQIDPRSLSDYDFIGFDSGIYNKKPHESLLGLVERLPQATRRHSSFPRQVM
jgi:hypothetical protein